MRAFPERYTIVRPLERGSDVRVYLLKDDLEPDREKVLTLLARESGSRNEARVEELEAALDNRGALDHPWLVRPLDLAFRGRRIGVVTEHLGVPLLRRKHLGGSRLGLSGSQRHRLAVQLAELLAGLHHRGIHCGLLKLSQLFVGESGDLKFNFVLEEKVLRKEPTGDAVRFAAPELLSSGRSDLRSDLYSLGMLLYCLFTDYLPFSERSPEDLLEKQLLALPLRPRALDPDVSAPIEELILHLVNKEPSLRPTSADYVAAALKEELLRSSVPKGYPLRAPIVGRQAEMLALKTQLQLFILQNKTSFVFLKGVSGIGKSALMNRVKLTLRLKRQHYLRISFKGSTGTTESPDLQCLPEGVFESVSPDAAREDIARTSDASHRDLYKESDPLVLLVDEGAKTRNSVMALYENLAAQERKPILVIGNYPEVVTDDLVCRFLSELKGQCAVETLVLEALSRSAIVKLVRAVTWRGTSVRVTQELIDLSRGIPRYVLEVISHLDSPTKRPGKRKMRSASVAQHLYEKVPDLVASNLADQLQSLTRDQQECLEVLSLIHVPVNLETLAFVLEEPIAVISDLLAQLDRHDLLRMDGPLSQSVVSIRDSWLRTVVARSISRKKKCLLHAKIGTALNAKEGSAFNARIKEAKAAHLIKGAKHLFNESDYEKVIDLLLDAVLSLKGENCYRRASDLIDLAVRYGLIKDLSKHWELCHLSLDLLYLSGRFQRLIHRGRDVLRRLPTDAVEDRANVILFLARTYGLMGEPENASKLVSEAVSISHDLCDEKLVLELEGELLSSLSRIGAKEEALTVAESLQTRVVQRRSKESCDKVFHGLFLFEFYVTGREQIALGYEAMAVKLALAEGKAVRAVARIGNSAIVLQEVGRFDESRRMTAFCCNRAEELENSELQLFCRTIACIGLRLEGRLKQARRLLEDILVLARQAKKRRLLTAELQVELARNANALLSPIDALNLLASAEVVIRTGKIAASSFDVVLVRARSLVLLGKLEGAIRLVNHLKPRSIARERGRLLLLKSEIHLQQGMLEEALKCAEDAWREFPTYMIHSRCRVLLQKAEVLLAQRAWEAAAQVTEEALRISRENFYFPLMAKAYFLKASGLYHQGEGRKGRVFGLRALQVARHVDEPGLKAAILHRLGKCEWSLGRTESADRYYSSALNVLRESLLQLPSEHRPSFRRRFMQPIEQDARHAREGDASSRAVYLERIRAFSERIRSVRDPREFGEMILTALRGAFPDLAGQVFFRSASDRPIQLVANLGKCRRHGREPVERLESMEDRLYLEGGGRSADGDYPSVAFGFHSEGMLMGGVYLEHGRGRLSEDAVDFFWSVKNILGLRLDAPLEERGEFFEECAHLEVGDGMRMLGRDPGMQRVFFEVLRIARAESTVLISGESGTGKELVAKAIHHHSDRRRGSFVPVNCSALPSELIENELFGHAAGSFTGAVRSKKGLFEGASGGTLFLDEIASMPLEAQSRLLRVLEKRTIRRIGDTRELPVDVRIVAATNQPLEVLVQRGEFRIDLFHRLNVYPIRIPPLRKRTGDIPHLARFFVAKLNRREGEKKDLSSGSVGLLCTHPFPGNVRELQNVLERAYYLSSGRYISASEISSCLSAGRPVVERQSQSRSKKLFDGLVTGKMDFWGVVRDAFLKRDLSREEVREIVSEGLLACRGNYRDLLEYFGMPPEDYKRFLAFLNSHDCKVDFRPFRRRRRAFKPIFDSNKA